MRAGSNTPSRGGFDTSPCARPAEVVVFLVVFAVLGSLWWPCGPDRRSDGRGFSLGTDSREGQLRSTEQLPHTSEMVATLLCHVSARRRRSATQDSQGAWGGGCLCFSVTSCRRPQWLNHCLTERDRACPVFPWAVQQWQWWQTRTC